MKTRWLWAALVWGGWWGAGVGAAESNAPPSSAVVFSPAAPVLGQTQEVSASISLPLPPEGLPPDSRLRISSSVGAFRSIQSLGDGRFVAAFVLPPTRFPQVVLGEVVLEGLPETAQFFTLPLIGVTRFTAESQPGLALEFVVAGKTLGPFQADGKGLVQVELQVPPGVGLARAVARPSGRPPQEQPLPLPIPAFQRLKLGQLGPLPADGETPRKVRLLVVDARGEPLSGAALSITASLGMVSPAVELGSGLYMAWYTPPRSSTPLEDILIARLQGEAGQEDRLRVSLQPVVATPQVFVDPRISAGEPGLPPREQPLEPLMPDAASVSPSGVVPPAPPGEHSATTPGAEVPVPAGAETRGPTSSASSGSASSGSASSGSASSGSASSGSLEAEMPATPVAAEVTPWEATPLGGQLRVLRDVPPTVSGTPTGGPASVTQPGVPAGGNRPGPGPQVSREVVHAEAGLGGWLSPRVGVGHYRLVQSSEGGSNLAVGQYDLAAAELFAAGLEADYTSARGPGACLRYQLAWLELPVDTGDSVEEGGGQAIQALTGLVKHRLGVRLAGLNVGLAPQAGISWQTYPLLTREAGSSLLQVETASEFSWQLGLGASAALPWGLEARLEGGVGLHLSRFGLMGQYVEAGLARQLSRGLWLGGRVSGVGRQLTAWRVTDGAEVGALKDRSWQLQLWLGVPLGRR